MQLNKYLMAAMTVFSFATSAESFEMLLTGKTQAGPHPNEERYVRKMIGGFVENIYVAKYLLRDTPANGGFQVCVDPADDLAYDRIVDELNRFAIRESIWEVTLSKACED